MDTRFSGGEGKSGDTRGVPVIFITALDKEFDEEKAFRWGR
jgi:PleD family two-component response regulator